MSRLLPEPLRAVERRLRLISILTAAVETGLAPVPISHVHLLAYLTDVLAPVWHLPVLDGQLLKRRQPFFPAMQHDLDRLVGMGVVRVVRFGYVKSDGGEGWRLDADYEPVSESASPILAEVEQHDQLRQVHSFVREVVYAASGLGAAGITEVAGVDATYSDPLVDLGGLIDIIEAPSRTVHVAQRFAELAGDERRLTDAELVHLYVRHLYSRMRVA